jgi:hypothetical protein
MGEEKQDSGTLAALEVPVAGRSRPTFNKLQKERARQEKQRSKAERKKQRKLEEKPAEGEFAVGQNPDFASDFSDSDLPETDPESNPHQAMGGPRGS